MKQLTLFFILLYTLSYGQMQETFYERSIFLNDGTEAILLAKDLPFESFINGGIIIDQLNAPSDMDAIYNYNIYRDQTSLNSLFRQEIGKGIIKTKQGKYYLINLYGDNY